MNKKLVTIEFAANSLEMPPKIITDWIKAGLLEMPEPGMVDRDEVQRVYEEVFHKRMELPKRLSINGIMRDRTGRFIPKGKTKFFMPNLPKDPD